MPALPLGDAGPYVAAAYLVFLALILIYVAIMASKLARVQRDIGELVEIVDRRAARVPATGVSEDDEAGRPGGREGGETAAGHPIGREGGTAERSEAGLR